MMLSRIVILQGFILLFQSLTATAQNENALVRKGNKQYEKNNFVGAEVNYKKSLEKNPNKPEAIYNLGNALVQQERYPDAIKQLEISSNMVKDQVDKHNAFHNLGNAYLQAYKAEKDPQKKSSLLDNAITSYKNSLKEQPYDYEIGRASCRERV